MNTNNTFTYQGLLNRNVGTNATCENMNATTITVTNLTVNHILGILCQVLNTSIINPELTLSFDSTINMFTVYLNDNAIILSRLNSSVYDSTAVENTMVFRDINNFTEMYDLTILNTLSAIGPFSTITNSNTTRVLATSVNASYYFPLVTTSTTGYKTLVVDTSNGISYNPSTDIMTITGTLSAVNNNLSTVSRSNQVNMTNDNGNHFNPLLFFQDAGTLNGVPLVDGYKNVNYDSLLTLVFNPNTHEFRITGAGSVLHLHNQCILTADSTGSFADTLTCSNGNYITDYPSIHLGDTTHSGIIEIHGYSNSGYSCIEGADGGGMDIFTKTLGSTLTLQASKPSNHTVCSSDFTASLGINIPSGQTYKINNVTLNTDNIQEITVSPVNLYYTDLRARTAIIPSNTSEINQTYSTGTGILTADLNTGSISNAKLVNSIITLGTTAMSLGSTYSSLAGAFTHSGTLTCSNGNNIQGSVYSATFGQASSTRSGQIALIDGTSNNQYVQLYCRSNIFGVQGNITSISLEKNTGITGTFSASLGINIPTGQTYKINNLALTTDNISATSSFKYLNSLSTSSTTEITPTFVFATGILSADLNTNSINPSKIAVGFPDQLLVSNHGSTASTWISMSGDATMNTGVLTIGSGVVSNTKLTNSSITINGTSVSLGGSLTIPTTTSVIDTSEINLTLTASTISGTLINNSISLARISTNDYNQATSALTLVQRKSGGGIECDSCTNISYVSALAGVSHTSIFSNITPSLYLGSSSYTDGVINLRAKSGTVGTMSGSIIQCNLSDLYIDNVATGNSINIGTMPISQNIYIGSLNNSANSVNLLSNGGTIIISSPLGLLQVGGSTNTITIGTGQSAGTVLTIGSNNSTPEIKGSTINVGSVSPIINIGLSQASAGTIDIGSSNSIITFRGIINYNALSFNNVKKQYYTNFSHNTSIPITVWSVVYSSTNILQTNITTRNVNSFIRITVNMPLNNWSTVATNKAISIARSTTAFTTGQTVTTDIVPPNTGVLTGSQYGVHHILSGIQYDACNVSYIDTTILGSGTFYYAVVVRANSLTITAPVLGNNSYVDISLEELF